MGVPAAGTVAAAAAVGEAGWKMSRVLEPQSDRQGDRRATRAIATVVMVSMGGNFRPRRHSHRLPKSAPLPCLTARLVDPRVAFLLIESLVLPNAT